MSILLAPAPTAKPTTDASFQSTITPAFFNEVDSRDLARPETVEPSDRRWWAAMSAELGLDMVADDDLLTDLDWEAMYEAGRDDYRS